MFISVAITGTEFILPPKATKNLSKTHEMGFQDRHQLMKDGDLKRQETNEVSPIIASAYDCERVWGCITERGHPGIFQQIP